MPPAPLNFPLNGNFIGTAAAPIDPKLGPLENNGGPTLTHLPLPGSPVINAGDSSLAVDPATQQTLFDDQRGFVRAFGASVEMGAVEVATVPFPLVVTTSDDELDLDLDAGDLSLREAIVLANSGLGANTITFSPLMAGQTILLTLGQMTISDALTIQGLGATQTTIDGQTNSRLFEITEDAGDVTFDGMTLTGGRTFADFEAGGAIRSNTDGELTIRGSIITGNSTEGALSGGGGVFSHAAVKVIDSTISDNSTSGFGSYGGGIRANGLVTVTSSTVSGNSTTGISGKGGGIHAQSSANITNSTISGNSTEGDGANGGGMNVVSTLNIATSTITGNFTVGTDADGGGVFDYQGSVTIRNSIVARNFDFGDASHSELRQFKNGLPSFQFSLIGDNTGTNLAPAPLGSPDANGNLIGTSLIPIDPRLRPLQFNGGPTKTHAPLFNSPAIDSGDSAFVSAFESDQRGMPYARVMDGTDTDLVPRLDMGALEFQSSFLTVDLVVSTMDDLDDTDYGPGKLSLREAVTFAAMIAGPRTITFAPQTAGQSIRLINGEMKIRSVFGGNC